MKATTLISAFLFAHAAFAQATESTSTSVSAGTVPASGSTATASVSAPAPESTTKSAAGAKSASKSEAQSSSAAGTPNSQPAATGSPATQTPSTSNPLIPSTISEGCSSYLNTLNTDPEIANCLAPLSDALSGYSASTGSASALSKTLTKLCSTKTCSSSTIRSKLTEFKDTCSEELTGANPNQVVINNYDVLYTAVPFRDAVCAKDFDSQTYCLLNATASAAATISEPVAYAASHMTNSVSLRRKRAQTVLVPNPDTYRNSNLLYLFTSPSMDAGHLCISCTQQILAKYFSWQQAVPHALGVRNSPLLGGQSELYSTIREKCPLSFADGISTVANVATPEGINSASSASVGSLFTAAAGALAAVMALL